MNIFVSLLFASFIAFSAPTSSRTVVHILDYVGGDYPGAVENGKIINPAEYDEQLELLSQAKKIILSSDDLQKNQELLNGLQKLETLIKKLRPNDEVFTLSQSLKEKIILISNIPIAPKTWPSLKVGKKVYETNCASCHGSLGYGDGPGAKGLNPPAANFHAKDRNTFLSPLRVFNTAKIGIEGTAMAGFDNLNDEELWAVSFYIFSLKHDKATAPNDSSWQKYLSLSEISNLSDPELLKKLQALSPANSEQSAAIVASIRKHSEGGNSHDKFINFAITSLDDALMDYKNNNLQAAQNKALSAYLEGVEPIEPKLKAKNPQLLRQIENEMLTVRQKMTAKQPVQNVEAQIHNAQTTLKQIQDFFEKDGVVSPWFSYFLSLSIILREALESLLVIITLLGVLRATGSKIGEKWLHSGWILALAAGTALWFFSGWIINLSGASRELLEGAISLLAVGILVYIGFWLHSKTEITKWNSFIKKQIESALSAKSLIGLALISFVAVAREAIEVVLFLRTILIDADKSLAAQNAVYAGMFSSVFFVALMAWLLLKYSTKVPVRQLFIYSSAIIGALAFVLTGKALHSLQEAGSVSITPLPFEFLRIDLLGLYPTLESIGAQLALLTLVLFLWNLGKKPASNTLAVN
ncbi:MAG: cytochrome c/FTR1 family iron permease [Oligoflexia bacterium]|nr:cytochrome c/FTR1 family iron permease [Oligoflexia bacterium]